MCVLSSKLVSLGLLTLVALGLCGCVPMQPAPTEEREVVLLEPDKKERQYRYVVNSGDTLYAISRLMGLTVPEVAAMNGLKPPYVIHPGQKLVVIRGSWILASGMDNTTEDNSDISGSTAVAQTPGTETSSSPAAEVRSPLNNATTGHTPSPPQQSSSNVDPDDPVATSPVNNTSSSSLGSPTETDPSTLANTESGFVARTEPRITFAETQEIQEQAKRLPTGWQWPVASEPSNEWSPNSEDGGLTYELSMGSSVKAAASGRVTYAGISVSEYKYMILIKTPDDYVVQYDFNTILNIDENDLVSVGDTVFTIEKPEGVTASDRYRTIKFAVWKRGVAQNPSTLIDE